MKRTALISIAIGIVLVIGGLAFVFFPQREPASLTLLQYHRWPHGATLLLTNNSSKTITCLTDEIGRPVLSRQKTHRGWTNLSPQITTENLWLMSVVMRSSTVINTNEIYLVRDPAKPPNAGDRGEFLKTLQLGPGQSTELYIGLEADGPPIQVGTVCIISQSKLAQRLGQWMFYIKHWCRLKSKPPGRIEVWCSEPLQVSSTPTHAEKRETP